MRTPTWEYDPIGQVVEQGEGRLAVSRSRRGRTVALYLETIIGARVTLYLPVAKLAAVRALLCKAEGTPDV